MTGIDPETSRTATARSSHSATGAPEVRGTEHTSVSNWKIQMEKIHLKTNLNLLGLVRLGYVKLVLFESNSVSKLEINKG